MSAEYTGSCLCNTCCRRDNDSGRAVKLSSFLLSVQFDLTIGAGACPGADLGTGDGSLTLWPALRCGRFQIDQPEEAAALATTVSNDVKQSFERQQCNPRQSSDELLQSRAAGGSGPTEKDENWATVETPATISQTNDFSAIKKNEIGAMYAVTTESPLAASAHSRTLDFSGRKASRKSDLARLIRQLERTASIKANMTQHQQQKQQ